MLLNLVKRPHLTLTGLYAMWKSIISVFKRTLISSFVNIVNGTAHKHGRKRTLHDMQDTCQCGLLSAGRRKWLSGMKKNPKSYGVFTPEQDNDKTRQMLNLCIPMMSDKPGVKGIIGMHRFNICLVVVLLWCENTITVNVQQNSVNPQ